MYIFPDMIDMGLKDGQEWPEDEAYRKVAQHLLLQNSLVFDLSTLIEGVQWVLDIPAERIRNITLNDILNDKTRPFDIPC